MSRKRWEALEALVAETDVEDVREFETVNY